MRTKMFGRKVLTVLLMLCMVMSLAAVSVSAAGVNYIDKIHVEYTYIEYKAGDVPQAAARVTEGECTVAYEYWSEIEQKEEGGVWSNTGRRWYSDADKMAALSPEKRITQFESGKHYSYNIVLAANSGSFIGSDNTVVFVGKYEWGTPGSSINLEVKNMSTMLYIYSPYSIGVADDSPDKFITSAAVENVKFDYQPGSAPQATATVAADDADKYEIVYECWQQFENNEPVAAWYSDNGSHGTLPTISKFENGKHYVYSIMLQPKEGYVFSSETVITVNGQKASAPFVGGSMYIPSIKTITPTKQTSAITSVDIENVKLNYQPGSAPQPTAGRTGAEQDKYDILYESWGKRVKDADDTITTVAYWYSDDSCYSDGDVRFNTFEKGGRYQYSIRLQAKDGYVFDSNLNNSNVVLNGQTLPFGSWVNVLDDGRTCLITYGTETRPGQAVEAIRLDAVIDFDAGDKPRFSTGIVDPFVDTDHQRWDADDGSGYGITSSEFWNNRYNGKLITTFEDGKSYTYGAYFKISDLGLEEGYRFDKNTKLYINGAEITLTPDQIDVDDNGETVWFYNVLTMTPKPAKTWQKIDVIEIEGATVNFKDGDKPAFTGKTPENAPYKYQFECWETKDGAGVNSAEFFDKAYEKHITAFESGETYQYILYFKAEEGYYFTADTKIKVNGTFYGYRLVNVDPDYDSSGRMYTFWAYTDLVMTPQASGTTPDYKITEGVGGSWTLGSDGTLKFSANGELSKLTGVKVDGALLAADKYTAAAEPTVITLTNDYLGTLTAGKHTLTVVYGDGECSADFEIKAAPEAGGDGGQDKPGGEAKEPDNKNRKPGKFPKTGDRIYMWVSLLLVSSVTAAAVAFDRKKKKQAGR